MSYALSDNSKIGFRLAHFWVTQDDSAFLPVVIQDFGLPTQVVIQQNHLPPSLRYTGWTGGLTANVRF
jgi:hypothetical protein